MKPANFLVLEDGVEQEVQTVRMAQTPITAVLLLEFAVDVLRLHSRHAEFRIGWLLQQLTANLMTTSRSSTFDMRTHILTDFTNNKDQVANSIQLAAPYQDFQRPTPSTRCMKRLTAPDAH